MAQRLVVKFGGTSVGSASAMGQAADIVRALQGEGHQVAVVTSAMSGVSDALKAKHETAAEELGLSGAERAAVMGPIQARLSEFALLGDALAVLGEASPRAMDAIGALGERMSIHLLAAALRARGADAVPVEASTVVRTDATFLAAVPDMTVTEKQAQATLIPLLTKGAVPVITGFIGATPEGVITTLGRGGSDYSGAI